MTPIKQACIDAGLPSVNKLLEITGVPHSTLRDWIVERPKAFQCLVIGAASIYAHQPNSANDPESETP